MKTSPQLKTSQVKSSSEDNNVSSEDMILLDRASAIYGTDAQIADKIGISRKTVSGWRKRGEKTGHLPRYVPLLLRLLLQKHPSTGMDLETKSVYGSERTAATDYIRRVGEAHREAKGAGRRKDDRVPLIQLMAALRRITASEDWAKRSAVIQVLLAFDPEIRDRWPELQDVETDALRRLLVRSDVEGQQER